MALASKHPLVAWVQERGGVVKDEVELIEFPDEGLGLTAVKVGTRIGVLHTHV